MVPVVVPIVAVLLHASVAIPVAAGVTSALFDGDRDAGHFDRLGMDEASWGEEREGEQEDEAFHGDSPWVGLLVSGVIRAEAAAQ